eukprot:1136859-Pelagomonas_calceolata.AAC.2
MPRFLGQHPGTQSEPKAIGVCLDWRNAAFPGRGSERARSWSGGAEDIGKVSAEAITPVADGAAGLEMEVALATMAPYAQRLPLCRTCLHEVGAHGGEQFHLSRPLDFRLKGKDHEHWMAINSPALYSFSL